MDLDHVRQAVKQLCAQGHALDTITAPQVRAITQHGSYTTITELLRVIRREALASDETAELAGEAEETGTEGDDDEAIGEAVALAQVDVRQAEQRLRQAQETLPLAEGALVEACHRAVEVSLWHFGVTYATTKGVLPPNHPLAAEADAGLWEAKRAVQAAQQRAEEVPKQIAAAEAALRIAQQQEYLRMHYPALLQRLAEVQAEDAPDPSLPNAYAKYAAWRQALAAVQAEIASVLT